MSIWNPAPSTDETAATDLAPVDILIVDDQPDGRQALQATLAPLKQSLVLADSGRDALRHALRRDFAVVLLDVVMPGLDGFETAELLRSRRRSQKTPIIFLTALSRGEVPPSKAYALGAVDYILKPIAPEILRSKVAVFVELAQKADLIRRQADDLRVAEQKAHERQLREAAQRLEAERLRAREELLRAEMEAGVNQRRWLEAVLDALPTPLWFLRPGTGHTVFSNEAARRAEGATLARASDDVSDHADDGSPTRFFDAEGALLPAEHLPAARAAAGESLHGLHVGWERGHASGSALVYAEALPALFGHEPTVIVAAQDVTDLAKAQADLRSAVGARDEFITVASHELKTPITAAALMVQSARRTVQALAADNGVMSSLATKLERAERNIRRLTQLVERLLDISRIRAGRLDLDITDVDLADVAREVTARFQDDAQRAGTPLTVRAASPAVGRWDRSRLDQVISNLVGNALKHAPGRPVDIAVSADADSAFVTVRDQGAGIREADQARIFRRFERGSSAHNVAGLGLGLWIVRRVVEEIGGRIRLESAEGQGAAFTVELPRGTASSTATAVQGAPPDAGERAPEMVVR